MFPLDPVDTLYDAIMRIIAQEPNITVARLHVALKRQGIRVTLQHVYRKVNALVDEQVLLKRGGGLTFNLMWLLYLEFFAANGKEALMHGEQVSVFPLKKGERLSFPASTLLEVQTLWHHLLVQLHQNEPQPYLFKFYSHAWWVWNKHTLDAAFYRKIYEKEVRGFWVYSGNTFLDREAATMYPDAFESRIVPNAPFPSEGYNLNVYGEYIFECLFPSHIAKHIELLFQTIDSSDRESLAILDDVFTMRSNFTVTVWRNPAQARVMQRQLARYFFVGARKMPPELEQKYSPKKLKNKKQ